MPIACIYLRDEGSRSSTRTHRMGAVKGARLFVDALLRRWGAQAMRKVDSKHHAAEVEAAYRASLPPVEIKPDARKPRRGRKSF